MTNDAHADCGGQHRWGRGHLGCSDYDLARERAAKAGSAQAAKVRVDNPSPNTVKQRLYFEKHPDRLRAKKKRFHEKHPEKRKEQADRRTASGKAAASARLWREKNPEKAREVSLASSLKKTCREHGIEPADYWAMHERQGGVCAICGKATTGKRLAIDHCHTTDQIRGLLCFNCNSALGKFYDDPAKLRRAAEYVEQACQVKLDMAS